MSQTVTVVLCTFNRAHLLSKAIDSVMRQTYAALELIVVDDGSSDNTREVVKRFGPRIRYIRHECNQGLPASRNTGIRAATGAFIAFIDDDDEWVADKLSKQLKAIGGREAVLCGAIGTNGKRITHRRSTVTVTDLRRGNKFPPSGLLARTTTLREVWFDKDVRQGEDWDAYIRLATRGAIGFIDEPLVVYNNDENVSRMTNAARNTSIPDLEKRMGVIKKHREFFGPYWFAYHEADTLLSYLRFRQARMMQVAYTIKRCGIVPVCSVIFGKLKRRLVA